MQDQRTAESDYLEVDAVETTAIAVPALSQEMQLGVQMARQFPRDLRRFQNHLMTAVSVDVETAAMCFYAKPQAGGSVLGPSVRLAELAVAAYGNMSVGSRPGIIDRQEMTVTGQGFAIDLEANSQASTEVVRSIRTRQGELYKDHMIQQTLQAAAAIARRNAIFQVIPRVYIDRAYKKARGVVAGEDMPLAQRRIQCLEALCGLGAKEDTVLASLGLKSAEMLTLDHILDLRARFVAIREGELLIDDAFPPAEIPRAAVVAGMEE